MSPEKVLHKSYCAASSWLVIVVLVSQSGNTVTREYS